VLVGVLPQVGDGELQAEHHVVQLHSHTQAAEG
jgi:hypothetical protein